MSEAISGDDNARKNKSSKGIIFLTIHHPFFYNRYYITKSNTLFNYIEDSGEKQYVLYRCAQQGALYNLLGYNKL